MSPSSWNLTEATKAVHDFTVNGYSATKAGWSSVLPSRRLAVGCYEWEIHHSPTVVDGLCVWETAFKLVFVGPVPAGGGGVRASLSCRLMEPSSSHMAIWREASGKQHECKERVVSHHRFFRAKESSDWVELIKQVDLERNSNILAHDSFRVRCVISVLKEPQ